MDSRNSKILSKKRDDLIKRLIKGKAFGFLEHHTGVFDDYFRQKYVTTEIGFKIGQSKNPCALIALGGYGRREQCVHSDIDLLFLFKKRVPDAAEALVREIIYPLWNMGIEVGHATRSIKECIHMAEKDYEVLTALLDARFICGMSSLHSTLNGKFKDKVLHKRADQVVEWLINTNKTRHAHFGDSAYLMQPNLKEGRGGLRDYHTIRWIVQIISCLRERRDLEYLGYFSNEEYQSLTQALFFIWQVRNHLHLLTKRKCDQLHYEYQKELADRLNFKSHNGQQPVEMFLGELHGHMEFIKQQHLLFLYDQGIGRMRKKHNSSVKFQGIKARKGMLYFSSSKAIIRAPALLMNIFQESARLKIPLSTEAIRLVREFSHLVDDTVRTSPAIVNSFEQILISWNPKYNVLNQMFNTGLLSSFIPELKSITNLISFDEYHLYTVDKHSLIVVRTIKSFGTPQDDTNCLLCGDLYREISNCKILLWAALLHDIGKGVPGGRHSEKGAEMVYRIHALKILDQKTVATISFLVREHLLLIKTATRRDIQDEETAISCARKIGDIQRLKMLYLLTVADSVSTGPKAWNDWTATLLRDFYLKVAGIIEGKELASKQAVRNVRIKKEAILRTGKDLKTRNHLEVLFNEMSPRYLLNMPVADIRKHIQLYRDMGEGIFNWTIAKGSEAGIRVVTICAKDRPGLISKIAGVFTLNSINILDVQVFTWRNNMAMDVFRVTPPPDRLFEDEKWEKARTHLTAVLEGQLDLSKALKEKTAIYQTSQKPISEQPAKVVIDNIGSSFFTIIEVFSDDFLGLLYTVTDALYWCGLDIWVAKIATKVDQVVDVFYVRDFDGQKIDSETRVVELRETILQAIKRGRGAMARQG